jgi:hypothetical protein
VEQRNENPIDLSDLEAAGTRFLKEAGYYPDGTCKPLDERECAMRYLQVLFENNMLSFGHVPPEYRHLIYGG